MGFGDGAIKAAFEYYKENGTLDGSGDYVLETATTEMLVGTIIGTVVGLATAEPASPKSSEELCFAADTLVLTTVGLIAIEDLQPGDIVYGMKALGEEQQVDLSQEPDRNVILETYAHEVDETYIVTIDGESIEATAEHPFYNSDGEEVQAKDLKEGDELATTDGDTATVDSVECIHHDEPVMVYNIAVCDGHTYYVGENNVLVHNVCKTGETSDGKLNWDTIVSKKGENRIDHINRHGVPNMNRATHGVFNGNPVDMVNEAWEQRFLAEPISDGMGGTIYNIPYKNAGYESGYINTGATMDYITIITKENSNELISAFPSFGNYHK